MKKVTELVDWKCDICGDVAVTTVKYPVVYDLKLDKEPLIFYDNIDLCDKCKGQILRVMAIGRSFLDPVTYVLKEEGNDSDKV